MSNYSDVTNIIQEITGQRASVIIPKAFVRWLGNDFTTALVFSQLLFWSDKGKRRDNFVYRSYVEWEEETCLSAYQVKRAADKLVAMGLIEVDLKKANGAPTLHYRLNRENLTVWLQERAADSQESPLSRPPIFEKLENPSSRNLKNLDFQETSKSLTVNTSGESSVNFAPAAQEIKPAEPAIPKPPKPIRVAVSFQEQISPPLFDDTPAGKRKASIAQAMQRGAAAHAGIQDDVFRLFRITPNWNTKTARDFLAWLHTRPATERLDTFAEWWWKNDWRGRQGQPPTLANIQELWGQAFSNPERPQSSDPLEAEKAALVKRRPQDTKSPEWSAWLAEVQALNSRMLART